MRLFVAIVTTVALSLAGAPAFADDFAEMNKGKDLGLELYESSVASREAAPKEVASVPAEEVSRGMGFEAEAVSRDIGLELYETHLAWEAELAEKRAAGIEAGGVGAEEIVKEKEFDYLGSTGSDLP